MSAHPPSEPKSGPNCWQCRHFAITHIPATPYACRLMGFQSRLLPCIEVLRNDGDTCRGFLPKGPIVSNLRQLF